MGGLVALTWIGVIAVPTEPMIAGATGTGAVTTGTRVGTTVKVSTKGLLLPATLVARNVVLTTPLVVAVPVMAPVRLFRLSPAGNALGATTA